MPGVGVWRAGTKLFYPLTPMYESRGLDLLRRVTKLLFMK